MTGRVQVSFSTEDLDLLVSGTVTATRDESEVQDIEATTDDDNETPVPLTPEQERRCVDLLFERAIEQWTDEHEDHKADRRGEW